jgi:hypothetical protein
VRNVDIGGNGARAEYREFIIERRERRVSPKIRSFGNICPPMSMAARFPKREGTRELLDLYNRALQKTPISLGITFAWKPMSKVRSEREETVEHVWRPDAQPSHCCSRCFFTGKYKAEDKWQG